MEPKRMLFSRTNWINHFASKWRSPFRLFLIVFSIYWSSGKSYAQYARSLSATKTYTSSGSFSITDLADITGFDPTSEFFAVANVDVLIVGGGGGAGRGTSAGGGGGGQVRVESIDLNLGASLNIAIGPGGPGAGQLGNNSNDGDEGTQTEVNLISGSISIGFIASGGKGGTGNGNGGYSGNGNPGGNVNGNGRNAKGGGGGGSGGPGTNGSGNGSSSTGGKGGDGVFVAFAGKRFGAGGGGNGRNGGSAGSGGMGNANPSGPGADATSNSGAGGGAGGENPSDTGGNGSDGKVVVQITYRILSVEYLYFNATYQKDNRAAILEWSTGKEWENSHFEIERAVHSVKEWETIGRVEGNGYSDKPIAYSFTDNDLPAAGGNIFFRLKQVDYDESFNYSNTKAIQVPSLREYDETWIAYPNPSTYGTEVGIKLIRPELYLDQTIYITLSNLLGQIKSFATSSSEAISPTISNWLNGSASGLYILDMTWGNRRQQIKLLRK
ncbi:T9SS type A sorting domain-containing protein [Algoriphagus persicinus]|uniref:T9SS type A sorting domain-containing protein n=1 Tax=Algoriphagus persicinus TaxID=3108754 RepID=UPI002B3DC418|nr:T9SS type A sorting domain-containing protein [Algoriphagus sp. E1-3-M2]MEB2784529.1 T9SS type A sorting domain-containing protein [Algoriphagus sp. E1-3-M2]